LAELDQKLSIADPKEKVRSKIDLVVASVLLDAGAGPDWKYKEQQTGKNYTRSEGLAVASFRMFMDGMFTTPGRTGLQVNDEGLYRLKENQLRQAFQISDQNPMTGFEGRFQVLQALNGAMRAHPEYFGNSSARPGNIYDFLESIAQDGKVQATDILGVIQKGLGSIWPGRITLEGFNLGDVWRYSGLGKDTDGMMPFHKLSQWLTYSLIEPLVEGGLQVENTDSLTGLAEYRNGGLFVDSGVLELKNTIDLEKTHAVDSDRIVEWRALTIALLDRLAPIVRDKLKTNEKEMPLGKILEGGTWAAGRKLANKKRPGGVSPLAIQSDGTVF